MNIYSVLLELTAAVVLLLFAISLLRTGIERSFGEIIRRTMSGPTGRIRAAISGCALAVLFQSSTAVAMLTAGFSASGLIGLETGLAVLLGADLGSALVVKVLTFDLHLLAPALLIVGGLMHLKAGSAVIRNGGTAVLGAALLLISLKMVGGATAPIAQNSVLPILVSYIGRDPVTAMLLAAVFTWALHSSVAAILLILTFASKGVISVDVGVPLILGTNLGGAMIAVWLTRGQPLDARRPPLGNLLFRACAALVTLASLYAGLPMVWLPGASDAAQLVNLHVIFNAGLVGCGLFLCNPMGRFLKLIVKPPSDEVKSFYHRDSALDQALISTPTLALAAAAREVLHMGELVSRMLEPVMKIMQAPTMPEICELQDLDHEVNRAHREIKHYIAAVNRGVLDEEQARFGMELAEAAIHLEYAGDVIVKSLLQLAEKRLENGKNFSSEGWGELTELHSTVASNVKLASSLLMSPDPSIARQLVRQKEHVRRMVQASSTRHILRLQQGVQASIESSNMHLEMARALKEINSLVTTMAYPRLIASGDLLDSRLTSVA
ncbi:Na/Pi cotransporter family protein [Agrobacterium salinitolerans]|uniref:Na/Pi cotransporter family protein n=1 Tax=Agrobacterium salinitolerans TaxID=1183413 RepID=UPI00098FFC26|nr:Na/Pi cotransporter family protein [Agrobacterium salinitolerans]OOO17984.1 hypothetical protein BS627_18395 [Agrobacterium salinitolerans]PNQ21244.1 Na/Pi cotransporter family protein [Rhizobium sp. YIC5082]